MRKRPETKHCRIFERILLERIHGKQNRKCFGGGPRSCSLRLRRRLRLSLSFSAELCDPSRPCRRLLLLPSAAMAARCASSGVENWRPWPLVLWPCAAGTMGAGSVGPEILIGKRVLEGESGRPVQSVCCAVGGRVGGPLEPSVQVRVRCGRFNLVEGRLGMPRLGKRGVLGESGSASVTASPE